MTVVKLKLDQSRNYFFISKNKCEPVFRFYFTTMYFIQFRTFKYTPHTFFTKKYPTKRKYSKYSETERYYSRVERYFQSRNANVKNG